MWQALLYIAAEDEVFIAHNRDKDAQSVHREGRDAPVTSEAQTEHADLEDIPLAGKSISGWLHELDAIAKEVEEELVSRDIVCHRLEGLEAVNAVLFEQRCFRRLPILVDSKFSYLHTVLNSGRGSGKSSGLPSCCLCGYILFLCTLISPLTPGEFNETCFILTAIILSIIYIEICRRIGVTILGSRFGEDFLIWPQTQNPEVTLTPVIHSFMPLSDFAS